MSDEAVFDVSSCVCVVGTVEVCKVCEEVVVVKVVEEKDGERHLRSRIRRPFRIMVLRIAFWSSVLLLRFLVLIRLARLPLVRIFWLIAARRMLRAIRLLPRRPIDHGRQ